jgi:DNA polymerase-1
MARKIELEKEIKGVLASALADKAMANTTGQLFAVRPDIKVNLGSRDQLIAGLACLGIRVYDTRAESFEEVKGKHPIVEKLLDWKGLEKFITAFGESVLGKVERDGRIHATFDQLGAVSGRIICRDPNLQQMPKSNDHNEDLRSCFIAPEGNVFLVADLSNIELRILAEISGDTTMLGFFAEGKDLHAETARLMFKLGPDVDTKKHLINGVKARDIAKTINFGIAYGMGPGSLAARIGVTQDDAKKLLATYKATYAGVVTYLDTSSRKAISQRFVASLSGRRRTFLPETLMDKQSRGEAERSARNHPIQGTNADIIKRALALLSQRLPSAALITHSVHDEICLQVSTDKQEEAISILKECMFEACRDFLKVVAIPETDVLVANYWIKG